MKPHELDQRRAEMMDSLYHASGRSDPGHPMHSLYTGLWQEFAGDVASNFRDTDYVELFNACLLAIGQSESHLGEKHAQQCIEVCRRFLLGQWL